MYEKTVINWNDFVDQVQMYSSHLVWLLEESSLEILIQTFSSLITQRRFG